MMEAKVKKPCAVKKGIVFNVVNLSVYRSVEVNRSLGHEEHILGWYMR